VSAGADRHQTAAVGKPVFQLLAALARFERDLLTDRTAAGLAAVRARGRPGGRPAVMTPTILQSPG
jgi:DNA invertase Pin-like site-specific DNA recombinase